MLDKVKNQEVLAFIVKINNQNFAYKLVQDIHEYFGQVSKILIYISYGQIFKKAGFGRSKK